VIRAVEAFSPSIVRIRKIEGVGINRSERFVGIGAVAGKKGIIVSDEVLLAKSFDESGNPVPHSFIGVDAGGTIFPLRVVGSDDPRDIVVFQALPPDDGTKAPEFVPVDLKKGSELKLGQSVVALGGEERDTVAVGIVSALIPTAGRVTLIKTDEAAASVVIGTLLINLSGELVGQKVGPESLDRRSYLPVALIDESISKITSAAGVSRE
jgi:S1-C subfamily serine protease